MNEVAWQEIEEDKANLQPTPPVGEKAVWYVAGDRKHPVPAQVVGIEGPGRLKLVVFQANSFPQHKAGVYHVSAKIHQKGGNQTTRNCGSWDYVRTSDIQDEDYDLHRQEIAKRETNLKMGEETTRKNEDLFAKKAAERAAAPTKKQRLPDPLPAPA